MKAVKEVLMFTDIKIDDNFLRGIFILKFEIILFIRLEQNT